MDRGKPLGERVAALKKREELEKELDSLRRRMTTAEMRIDKELKDALDRFEQRLAEYEGRERQARRSFLVFAGVAIVLNATVGPVMVWMIERFLR